MLIPIGQYMGHIAYATIQVLPHGLSDVVKCLDTVRSHIQSAQITANLCQQYLGGGAGDA